MTGLILGLGRFVPAWVKRAAAWAAVAAVALLGAWGAGRREGRSGARADAAEDTVKRVGKGQASAAKAKAKIDAGETADDLLRRNDGKW